MFLKGLDCFPNTVIAYRIVLTIPVTVASAERSFSKLKLLKSYLRSTMLQERLNGLALIAIENDLLENIAYEDLVDDFASKKARRRALFK
ncbi:hAT family dimerization domain [Euphorbia peplus]|nr:hAT family dimerization domain [Euphorbia peplus]